MEQFFIGIESYLIYGYSLSLIASILIFKQLNSHSVSSIVMIFYEIFTLIENILYEFILALGIHSGRVVWYLSWILFSLVSVWTLEYLHRKMSLTKSLSFKLIRIGFFSLVVVNFYDCLDRYTVNHENAWFFILFMKSTIQIGIVFALFIGLFETSKVNEALPYGAHNRAVNWYQKIQELPADKYIVEIEKWKDYVKDLPSNTFSK